MPLAHVSPLRNCLRDVRPVLSAQAMNSVPVPCIHRSARPTLHTFIHTHLMLVRTSLARTPSIAFRSVHSSSAEARRLTRTHHSQTAAASVSLLMSACTPSGSDMASRQAKRTSPQPPASTIQIVSRPIAPDLGVPGELPVPNDTQSVLNRALRVASPRTCQGTEKKSVQTRTSGRAAASISSSTMQLCRRLRRTPPSTQGS